jgi:hypothetical protein
MDAHDQERADREMLGQHAAGKPAPGRILVGLSCEFLERKREGGHPVKVGEFRPLAPGARTIISAVTGEEFPGAVRGSDSFGHWEVILDPEEPPAEALLRPGMLISPRGSDSLDRWEAALAGSHPCGKMMTHPDGSEAACVLDGEHKDDGSDHVDEHGHHAKVLVTQATLRAIRGLQDWHDAEARREEEEPSAKSLTALAGCGPYLHGYMTGVAQELRGWAKARLPAELLPGLIEGLAGSIEAELARLRDKS